MSLAAWLLRLVRLFFAGWAILLLWLVHCPWLGLLALGLLAASTFVGELTHPGEGILSGVATVGAAWACSLVVGILVLGQQQVFVCTRYFAEVAWLIALAVVPGKLVSPTALNLRKLLVLGWGFVGVVIWLADSYLQNLSGAFYLGLAVALGMLVLSEIWIRLPAFCILIANTLILIVVGLPIADLCLRPGYKTEPRLATLKRYYSYAAAKEDPQAFARWADYFRQQWNQFEKDCVIRDPNSPLPFRLRPNSRGRLFGSHVSINSMGFRGKEIPEDKGEAYRIVALGESTTFGITLDPDDRPWLELLEQIIQERLNPARPVEVINAGVPGATLPQNLHRLEVQILALKPDMIISYHGYNGFHLIDEALPRASGKAPPIFHPRPIRLLADCEYRLKLRAYKQKLISKLFFHTPALANPLATSYARAYQALIEIAQTNHIRLALANFSMAVNLESDPAVIEFYRAAWPVVASQIKVNVAHSTIVQQLAEQHPEIIFVDTHPGLDGEHEKFIDLVHFSQQGEHDMAEAFFARIRPVLEADLANVRPGRE